MADLTSLVTDFKRFAPAIVDAYFVVDHEKKIVDFNRIFFSLLPRQAARGLKGKLYTDVVQYDIGTCIAEQAWSANRHVRLDEISGHIKADPDKRAMRFILSAMPILDGEKAVGALVVQRDVTDEAEVQVKYQDMLETEAMERERLATQIQSRTKELLDANQLLLRTQKELLSYKRGLLI